MISRNKLLFTSIIVSLMVPFLLYKSWSISIWIDSLFLVGLLLLIICSIMILIEGDFFTAFIKSSKHFFYRMSKKEQVIRESEKRPNHTVIYGKNFPSRKIFFEIGILFCVISLTVSIFSFI